MHVIRNNLQTNCKNSHTHYKSFFQFQKGDTNLKGKMSKLNEACILPHRIGKLVLQRHLLQLSDHLYKIVTLFHRGIFMLVPASRGAFFLQRFQVIFSTEPNSRLTSQTGSKQRGVSSHIAYPDVGI